VTESDATDDPPPQQSVAEAVRARGHQTLWDYLRANPGVPMVEVAETLEAAPAVVLSTTYAIGNVLAECREDFIALGMPLTAQAVHEAMQWLAEPYPRSVDTRKQASRRRDPAKPLAQV
jgi:hypothetical protein